MAQGAPSISSTKPWESEKASFPTLFERYQILGVLGEGGMGTVFKGFHVNLKRHVAFKTMRLDRTEDPDLIRRFLREMEVVGQMDHPNVVRATDAGQKNGVLYLVMEYLSGQDLARLAQRRNMETADACELIRQAALGLDYIHQTLVHRDIKPSNLLLTTDGLVKILDLGLARCNFGDAQDPDRTPTGCAVGTYAYMAPEQALAGADADGRADIYSLGCTLYKLLSGRVPFGGPDHDNAARQVLAHRQIPLAQTPGFAAIPETLRPLLLRMTAKTPEERVQTAAEVARELTPFAAGSEPLSLLRRNADGSQEALRPLSQPLPEILSRLAEESRDTPRQSQTVTADLRVPAPRRLPTWGRTVLLASIVAAGLAVALVVVPLPWPREVLEEPGAPKNQKEVPVVNSPPPVEPTMFSLPLPQVPLRSLEEMKPVLYHDLLKHAAFPPDLIGYRKGDGLASGSWIPGEEKLELNPTSAVLVQLGTTGKEKPGFTFQTRMLQRPWHGNVGLFWGYREDSTAKTAQEPGKTFATFQMLYLTSTRTKDVQQFYVARARGTLQFGRDGRVLAGKSNRGRHDLPNLGDEKYFMIDIKHGKLAGAHFGNIELAKLCTAEVNKMFQPEEYRGAFGVFSDGANVTVRTPSVLPHADN